MSEIVDCIAFIIGKIFWSISVFLKFLGLRLLDLLGLVFNLLACCTIFRLSFMIAQFKDMTTIWEWRFQGLIQLLIFLIDVPVFIMGVIICLTLIRIVPCAKELSKNWKSNWKHYGIYCIEIELYVVVIKQFFTLFIDIFCVPSAVVCLLSWRSVIFVNRIRKSNSDWEKRKICFVEFFQLLVDAPLLLCFIPVIISWRLPFLIEQVNEKKKNNKSWNQIRFLGIYQLCLLCLDIPCFLVLLITLVTWRSPVLVRKLSKKRQGSIYESSIQSKLRRIVFLQFFYIFIDIPCIIAAGFVFASFIHASTLISKIKEIFSSESPKSFTKKEFILRRTCFYEFFMVFIDLICTVLMVIILLTIWRSNPLIKDIKKYFKRHENSPKKEKNENKQYPSNETSKESLCEPCETVLTLAESNTINEENETIKLNDKSKEEKDSLSWSKFLWKVRKSIVIHFVMLLIDIPAIPLCLFLLLTLLRASKVISALISGQFYMVFSITVYYQTLRFFVDLFFMLLFVVLMFLRPIQLWIQLLEDEDHKNYRLTCEFMLWLPDIINKRKGIYNSMNEVLIVSIKEGSEKQKLESDLVSTMQAYIESIDNLLKKFTDSDIEDEITYLLECISLMEKKRVGKLVRKFTFEKNFMIRPNISLHTENRLKWEREMNEYEKKIEGYFQSLVKYKPEKIPLYESKSGLSLRSRKETQNVLIECLPRGRFLVIFGALLCCLPLYRAPTLIKKLYMRWYDRTNIVVCTIKEYFYDLLTIFRMIVVVLFIYRAPFMLVDVLDCIIEKRSWKSVREAVKEYPLQMLEDFFSVVSLLFSWKTPRFIISTLLFGLFMPADLLLGVIRKCVLSRCAAYLLTIITYIVFMCFPLVLIFYITQLLLSKGMGWIIIVILCVFLFLLLITLLIMVTVLAKDGSKKFLVEMPTCDYVRYSWFNMHVILFEIIELLQSVALVFKLPSIPMYGEKVLQTASMYMLLGFIPFKAVFWVTVLGFICWFFICGAPIILENILKLFPLGTCGKKTSWRLLVSLFANTLFVTIVENLSSFSACDYPKCQYTILLNDTCLYSRLIQDNSLVCWTAPHSSYAAFSLIALVWFMITSFVFGVEYGDPEATEQDIGFSPIYNSIVNIFKAVSIIAVTFITNNNYVVLGILLFSNLSLVIYTTLFKRLFKHDACNLPSFLVWRVFSFVSSVVVTVAVIVAIVLNNKASKIPLIIIGSGVLVSLLVSIIIALKLRQISDISRDREEYRVAIILLKKKLEENNWLVRKWKKQNDIWLRLVKSVREAKKGDKNIASESWNLLPPQPGSSSEVIQVNSSTQSVDLSSSNITVEVSNVPSENNDITNEKLNQVELVKEHALLSTDFETNIPSPPAYDAVDSLPAPPKYDVCLSGYDPIQQTMLYEDSMLRLQKNGRNLLLILEHHINYEAFKYSFFSQRNLWLNAVCNSNWTGLLHCLQILNSNVDGSFYRPTPLDISLSPCSLETDILEDENAESEKPKLYVKLTKVMREKLSADIRAKALQDISELEPDGDKWLQLFEKVLPTTSIFKAWNFEPSHQFSLILNKPATGKIVEIAEGGNKLAKGATVSLKKKIMGTINNGTLSFTPGFELVAKKGPITVNVKTISLFQKNDCWYIEANGKKVKFDVGMASCKEVQWS